MVRIAHISDSHLGSDMFQLVERREDVRKCLKKAVDMAIRHSPDIIVHTGDLFDSPFPHLDDVRFAMQVFKDIPEDTKIIVLQGNHDIPYNYRRTASPVRLLETAGLVTSTGNGDYASIVEDVDGKQVDLHLVSWTRKRRFREILRNISPDSDLSLFFSHHMHVDKDELPSQFNYMGFGHAHTFLLDEEYDIGKPGSTCIVYWARERKRKKKMVVIETDRMKTEYQTETLNDVREFKFLTDIDISGMTAKEAQNLMKKKISELSFKKKTQPIIIMEVEGLINIETEIELDRTSILKFGDEKLEPLFFHLEPNWRCVGPRRVELSKPLDVITSVEEYIEATGEDDPENIMRELQRILQEGDK